MAAEEIQADFEALNKLKERFAQQSALAEQTLNLLRRNLNTLEQGGWIGEGARKFYAEMNDSVMPSVTRLKSALANASTGLGRIVKEMEQADEEMGQAMDSGV